MPFHIHIFFSSVWVAEWPHFWEIAVHSLDHMFSLYFDYLVKLFPVLVLRPELGFKIASVPDLQFLIFAYFLAHLSRRLTR